MTYHYRRGAIVTLVRGDGQPGPGEPFTYKAVDGWKVEIQDEGCVEITQYGAPNPAPRHQAWRMPSQTRGPVSLPGDAAAQYQPQR